MRSRLLACVATIALAVGGLLVVSASPASAGCVHNTHPNEYNGGDISWGNGTAIRTGPHLSCRAVGRGYPNQGIDVHCAVLSEHTNWTVWLFVHNTSTGKKGWSRASALHHPDPVAVGRCGPGEVIIF